MNTTEHPVTPLYGRWPRRIFEQQYRPITFAEHWRAARRAIRCETSGPDDVLMERVTTDEVLVLPADCMPYCWRTMWRLREPVGLHTPPEDPP